MIITFIQDIRLVYQIKIGNENQLFPFTFNRQQFLSNNRIDSTTKIQRDDSSSRKKGNKGGSEVIASAISTTT